MTSADGSRGALAVYQVPPPATNTLVLLQDDHEVTLFEVVTSTLVLLQAFDHLENVLENGCLRPRPRDAARGELRAAAGAAADPAGRRAAARLSATARGTVDDDRARNSDMNLCARWTLTPARRNASGRRWRPGLILTCSGRTDRAGADTRETE